MYEIPSAAGGDEGLEGFSVVAGERRLGRVAALNRTGDGLVLVVDTGDAYRPLPVDAVAAVETAAHTIRLTEEGAQALAAADAVVPRVLAADSPRLVRHVPRELERVLLRGEQAVTRRSRLWYVGGALTFLGGVGVFAGVVPTAEGVGGSLRWLWTAVPAALLLVGLALLWEAYGRDSPRRLSPLDKVADAASFFFAISPRTRKRG